LKVTERRDDTTNGAAESRPERKPGDYYYDDATGYEPYTPEEDDEEPEDEGREGEGQGITKDEVKPVRDG
jgi:hypothetical protein